MSKECTLCIHIEYTREEGLVGFKGRESLFLIGFVLTSCIGIH